MSLRHRMKGGFLTKRVILSDKPIILFFIFFLSLGVLVGSPSSLVGQEGEETRTVDQEIPAEFKLELTKIQTSVARLEQRLINLRDKYLDEMGQRDLLILRKRFVDGRDFFYKLEDYVSAAEIFYGIVHHPVAPKLSEYGDAVFYLGECLYHAKNYRDAVAYYKMIHSAGPGNKFFGESLVRLIEISLKERNWGVAQEYYRDFRERFPKDQDGSAAMYLMGKSYYQRGDRDLARQFFENADEEGSYYGMAQYFLGVMLVEENRLPEAAEHFLKLNERIKKGGLAHQQRLYELTHLSLGRILYELDDFPRAIKEYYVVPDGSSDYPQALYEAMWVFITRNDEILQTLALERDRFVNLRFDYEDYLAELKTLNAEDFTEEHLDDLAECEEGLEEIRVTLEEMENSLNGLMEEARVAYENLVKVAPKSSLVPEAEVLLGNLYVQVKAFQEAEGWFRELKEKYSEFKQQVIQAENTVVTDQDYINLTDEILSEKEGGEMAAGSGTALLPPEVRSWLAERKSVTEPIRAVRDLEEQEKKVAEMEKMMQDVEQMLQQVSVSGDSPLLEHAKNLAKHLRDDCDTLVSRISEVRSKAASLEQDEQKYKVFSVLEREEQRVIDIQQQIAGVDSDVALKRAEQIARFRRDYSALGSPVQGLQYRTSSLSHESKLLAADLSKSNMKNINRMINSVILQATLGEIDVAWRRSEIYDEEINKILKEQEDEILLFKKE